MKDFTPSEQLSLEEYLSTSSSTDYLSGSIVYNGVPVNRSTFKAGLAVHVHRWFRLTPSFGPDLVRQMLSALEYAVGEVILDPFAGAATTLIECQLEDVTAYGFEINPFLQFVGKTSLNWNIDTLVLEQTLDQISKQFTYYNSRITLENLTEHHLQIPPIHNPFRWWRQDVLRELLVLKYCINNLSCSTEAKDFFRLALAGVLVPDLTNVTLGRLQLHFIDRSSDTIHVLETFLSHATTMINDLQAIQQLGLRQKAQLIAANSTDLKNIELAKAINCVITSPPYPNRYSYVWNTRPHLYFFDFFNGSKEAAELDKATIGGTWGSATSMLAKGRVEAEFPVVAHVTKAIVDDIRRSDNLMANYAMKYFNLLARQINEMDKLLAQNARVAYVVGCSNLKDVYIETDVLLAKIFEGLGLGYKIQGIERIRRRHSGKDLHESIVYAWKKQL